MTSAEQREDTHDVIASNYIYLWGVAVHKQFFKYWTITTIIATLSVTLVSVYTNWMQLLLLSTLELIFIRGWMISFPALLVGVGVFYLWYKQHKKQKLLKRKQQEENQKIRQILMGVKT